MIKRSIFLLALFSFSLLSSAQAPRPYTSSEILLQLKKLNTVGSVLYIAAHPDDENTRLIAYLANEKCLRTGYLSLTRGDGGQNLIGPEQGIELGVIRTQELLAARRTDGGEQFFTRAYDFGFSKTPEETFRKWNKDSVLGDVVWAIRNFRPDIIITRFAPDGSGGHGHHTASAILAEEAFDAAGDPNRFPEQLKYVDVWKPRRMFYNTVARFRNPNADMSSYIPLDVGGYNALLGKSYGEIAAESRSMHKSQGFGSAKQRGEMLEHFKPVKGDTSNLKGIFDGMDFTWKRVKGAQHIGSLLDELIRKYEVSNPEKSLTALEKVRTEMEKLKGASLAYQQALAVQIQAAMGGIFVDATSSEPDITLGSKQKLTVTIINRNAEHVQLNQLQFPGNLVNQDLPFDTLPGRVLEKNTPAVFSFESVYGKSDLISQHYNLRKPIKNTLFDVDDRLNRSAPELFVNSSGTAMLTVNGHPLPVPFRFQYRWVDPSKGELYRPLVITPPVMINVVNEVVAFNEAETKEISLVLKAGKDSVNGLIKIAVPSGWQVELKGSSSSSKSSQMQEAGFTFSLPQKDKEETFILSVTSSKNARSETLHITAVTGGKTYTKGIKEIKYDHIPVQTLFPEAEVKLVKLDVNRNLKRIGYIPGAGDEVQTCLVQLGYEVVTITDDMLAKEDLMQFDAIVTGVRAYNTNAKLPSYKQKLMNYVFNGGNLVVQYNTNSWAGPLSSDIGPYPFKITRDRITDEEAKVRFLLPDHPVFNTPNKITEKDFEGWIQERSIYHAGEWNSSYEAPLAMADPGENENQGALLVARHGKGHFIYTGLVFFRELPAGVPGAYRFMVNLIELGK